MEQVLIFRTGETTCSEKPAYEHSMCPFVRTRRFGTDYFCALYDAPLHDSEGWLQRLPECMANHRGTYVVSAVRGGE